MPALIVLVVVTFAGLALVGKDLYKFVQDETEDVKDITKSVLNPGVVILVVVAIVVIVGARKGGG